MEKFFVVIKPADGGFISPFLLSKHIETIIGKNFTAKNTKEGTLMEINEEQIVKVNKSMIQGREIKAEKHAFMNNSKGTIYYPALNYAEDSEILEELKEQGVKKVTRFLRKGIPNTGEKGVTNEKGIPLQNTGVFLIEFNTPKRPDQIVICHEKLNVRSYYPNPRTCNNCGDPTHSQTTCRNTKRCLKCSEIHDNDCTSPAKCINCSGNHVTYFRNCPTLMQEKKVIKYAVDNNISKTAARKRIQITHGTSYAGALKNNETEQLKQELANMKELNQILMKRIEAMKENQNNTTTIKPSSTDSGATSKSNRNQNQNSSNRNTLNESSSRPNPRNRNRSESTNTQDSIEDMEDADQVSRDKHIPKKTKN